MVLHLRRGIKMKIKIKMKLCTILGFVKDRISIGRVRLRMHRRQRLLMGLQVAVICATSHDETPAKAELLFQAGSGARMHISQCLNLLMARLNKTKSWIVALKCLTLVHKALNHEGFGFHDQLRIHLNAKGKNYLNLSRFRDRSTALAWEASSWIRWYANFLEILMDASRQLGWGLDCHSKLTPSEKLSGMSNNDLMTVTMLLHGLLHEICQCPLRNNVATRHRLIQDALQLVVVDSITTQDELRVHLKKVCERHEDLSTTHISELMQVCETLTADSAALVQHTELAIAMNLLQPQQCLERILFTDYELLSITTAMKASQGLNAALAMTSLTKKDISSGLLARIKLAPPGNWKSYKPVQRTSVALDVADKQTRLSHVDGKHQCWGEVDEIV